MSKGDLEKLAAIPDSTDRSRAVGLMIAGMSLNDVMNELKSRPEISVKAKASAEEKVLTDEEWLDRWCGEFRKLIEDPSRFDRDALRWRHDRDNRGGHRGKATPLLKKARKVGYSPYAYLVAKVLFICHPADWFRCEDCWGKNLTHSGCTRCNGNGYIIREDTKLLKEKD